MESNETLDNVEEMKATLKEILNVLKDIKEDFKAVSYSGEIIKPTKKAKDNVETT